MLNSFLTLAVGAVLGYIVSYLQRRAQNAREYDAWERDQFIKDIQVPLELLRQFQALAEAFAEAVEDGDTSWAVDVLNSRRAAVNDFVRNKMQQFGPGIRTDSLRTVLKDVDRLTNKAARLCLSDMPTAATAEQARNLHKVLQEAEEELMNVYKRQVKISFGPGAR